MRLRRYLRRLAIVLTAAMLLAGILAAGLLGLMQTAWAKQYLTRMASARLSSSSGARVTLAPIEGWVPGRLRVPELVVEDDKGPCLRAEDIVLVWLPLEALLGRLHVREVGAATLQVFRLPQSHRPVSRESPKPPREIGLLSHLCVDRFYVSRASIANQRSPVNTDFSVEGSLAHEAADNVIHSSLRIEPLEGPATSASVEASLKPDLSSLSLQGSYSEAAGGIVAGLLRLKSDQPVSLSVHGDGPLMDWHGAMAASGGTDGFLNAKVRTSLRHPLEATMQGAFRVPKELVSERAAAWLAEENSFRLAASADAAEKLNISDLTVASSKANVGLSGGLDLAARSVHLEYAVSVTDAALMSGTTGFSCASPLAATGTMDGPLLQPHVALDLQAAAAEYRGIKATTVRCHLDGDLDVPRFAPLGVIHVEGDLDHVTGLPSPAAEVTDGSLTFSSALQLEESGQFQFADLHVKTPHATLEAHGSFDAKKKSIEASYKAAIPRADFISTLAKRPAKGSIELEGSFHGMWPALEAKLTAQVKEPAIGGVQADSIAVTAQMRDIPEGPNGHFNAIFRKNDQEGTILSNFVLRGKTIELTALKSAVPGGQTDGDIAVDLVRRNAKGALHASFDDLSWVGRLTGRDLAGKAKADIKLSVEKDEENIGGSVTVEDLKAGRASMGRAVAEVDLKNAFKTPYGRIRLTVSQSSAGPLIVDNASAEIEGDSAQGTFDISLKGKYRQPVAISTSGKLTRSGQNVSCRVTKAEAQCFGYPIMLKEPFVAAYDGKALRADKIAFGFDPGELDAGVEIDASAMHVKCALDGLTLDRILLDGKPVLSGTVSGSLDLNGAPSRPEGSAQVHLQDLRLVSSSLQHIDPASLTLEATLRNGLLRTHLAETGGLLGKPLQGDLDVPLRFSAVPFMFDVPKGGALKGKLAVHADLSRVGDLLRLDDQRLAGTLDLTLDVSGTVAEPRLLQSKGSLQNASYEHFALGTVLKDARATLSGDGSRLRIEDATASDGGKGRIDASGSIELSPAKSFPLDLDVKLTESAFVRRDDVTATVNGNMRVIGTLGSPKVTGKVQVVNAEVGIPERSAQSASALEVIDKGAPKANKESETAGPASPKPRPAGLQKRLSLDMDVEAPGRVFVRGRGLDSEWKGACHVGGNALEPLITGNVALVRGQFSLLGNRFTLSRGNVQFNGAWPPTPTLEVDSETQLKDMTAYLKVSGTTAAPSVQLESDPPANRDEILARILFGRGLANISPFEALQLAEATDALAGGKGPLQITERVRRILRVDQIGVTQASGGLEDTPQRNERTKDSAVRVGKYLRKGVYVEVQQGLGSETGKVQTDVNITPNLSLESTLDRNARTGIGLKWKKNY